MFVHKILRGEGAGLYLPFGLARLKALERIKGPKAYWTQKYDLPGVTIEVQQSPPFQYLRIIATGGIRYEFFTSEHVTDALSSPGHPGYLAGAAMRASFSSAGPNTKPLYSTELAPGVGDSWVLRTPEQPSDSDTGLVTWPGWQNQKYQEGIWFAGGDGNHFVTSTHSQPGGSSNKCGWRSPYFIQPYQYAFGGLDTDYGLDVPPALYSPGATPVIAAPTLEQPWLYWRAAVVRRSTDGTRRFFVCTDNYGRFHVYPVRRYPFFLATPGEFKTYTPPYPAWVTVPDIDDELQYDRDWLWRFNSDASKCVAIPFHSEEEPGYYKYNLPYSVASPPYPPYQTLHATIPSGVEDDLLYTEYVTPALNDTPGLVEFGIEIAITGPDEMDYEASFTLMRNSYFGDDQRYFFDAAYTLVDAEHAVGHPSRVERDTLVTAEIECKVPSGNYWATRYDVSDPSLLMSRDLVVNMRSACVLNTNDVDMNIAAEKLRFPVFSPGFFEYLVFPIGANTIGNSPPAFVYFQSISNTNLIPFAGTPNPLRFWPAGPSPSQGPYPFSYGISSAINPREGGNLYALELSTLSAVYSKFNYDDRWLYFNGIAYGDQFFSVASGLSFMPTTPPPNSPALVDATETVPSARPYLTILRLMQQNNLGAEFCVHPSGNWSVNSPAAFILLGYPSPYDAFDWISVVTEAAAGLDPPTRVRYTHRELYNTAFAQSRPYSFYTVDYFPGKNLADHGGFRTAGFWIGA